MKRNTHRLTALGLIVIVSFLIIECTKVQAPPAAKKLSINEQFPHPLNPLDTNEINSVKAILLREGKIDSTHLFYVINLNEPPKAEMLAWQPGTEFRREAFASVFERATNKTYEAVVDLKSGKVISFDHIAGVTPGSFRADSIAIDLVMKDERWLQGLATRGIHPDSVTVMPYVFAGEMGIAPPDHRELICTPYYKDRKLENIPIDGLAAYVDITDMKVLKVLDDGGKGFYKLKDIGYFNSDSGKVYLPKTRPLKITQPQGTSYTIEGFQVTSPVWSMRVGLHNREGIVLYNMKYNDRGNMRPVMYRASVSEMYVPYGSNDLALASWNYFDGGAYRMGQAAKPWRHNLKAGADVPENSSFLPAFYHNEQGKPAMMDSVIAVYEEFPGPITRHGEFSQDARQLVVKYFTQIGNYDYGFKWIFKEDGTIDLKVELTGIVGIKAVNRVTDAPGNKDETDNGAHYGTLVAPHVEAVNHQHFLSFRLDLDVDGTENIIEEMNTVAGLPGKNNPWNNTFVTQMSLIKNESEGRRNLNAASNRHWMVANAKSVNALGQPKSYVLMPGHNSTPYAAPGSPARRMADFLESQLWVTAYHERESFAAGDYPNSRGLKDGLPSWMNNENLQGQDAVVWYNMGITHIVRPEDWPVMNVHQIGFTMAPFGFFDANPVAGMKPASNRVEVKTLTPPDVTLCVPLPKQ